MKKNFGPVWVIAEQRDCHVRTVSLQLLGKARQLAERLDVAAETVVLGHRLESSLEELSAAGARRIYMADHVTLENYEPEIYLASIVQLARRHQPEIILMGTTAMGRELAPLVAAKLETGLTAHCIDLQLNDDNILEQYIPAYGGLLSITCPQRRPQMATVAKGVFPTPSAEGKGNTEIVAMEPPIDIRRRVHTLEVVVTRKSDEVQLESAERVVAGGAGARDKQGWSQIAELAETLNAALGCTRPVVDAGWAPLDSMIGQSGRMVKPELYIGVGLSGEQQHMVGISGAKLMVAINNDERAPVFEQVDIGVAEECQSFLPILIEAIKARRQEGYQ